MTDMMSEKEIEKLVIEIVADQLNIDKDEISRASRFVDDLNIDQLDEVELVMEFEDEFELSIHSDEKIRELGTVGAAIDFVRDELKTQGRLT